MFNLKAYKAWQLALVPLAILTIYIAERRFLISSWLETLCRARAGQDVQEVVLSRSSITDHIQAILDPNDPSGLKMSCPEPNPMHHAHLRPQEGTANVQYLFALNLRDNLPILPRLLGSVIEAIRFLGVDNCVLSIVEGHSQDGTSQVLTALQIGPDQRLETHFVLSSDIDPLAGSHLARLADLRNLALKPLLDNPDRYKNATVVFLNHVAICPDDILELVHQRAAFRADMTCAMDWDYQRRVPTFHDVYTARGITGDLFFDASPNMGWYKAASLFWNDPQSRQRYYAAKPVQVFSCWNGAAVFTAEPLVTQQIAFRAARDDLGECLGSETEIFCRDMWVNGYGKIAVIPSVNVGYTNYNSKRIKRERGYTAHPGRSAQPEDRIYWKPPPAKVKCMPTLGKQSWHAWNETLERE
ncbi:family 69 glycosyltransferase [Thozetella sp. PMI_491]|nr:family 69 glycosyltransferase [Thozetella sp. PMI_491]